MVVTVVRVVIVVQVVAVVVVAATVIVSASAPATELVVSGQFRGSGIVRCARG